MRRREFITIFAGAVAWPRDALAQQSAIPVIGFLSSASPKAYAGRVAAFRKGLNESGYIDGQDVAIEFRWAQGQYDRLPVFAADLVRQKVAVIVSSGGDVAALSAKAATSSIPIVTCTTGSAKIVQRERRRAAFPGRSGLLRRYRLHYRHQRAGLSFARR
jgi:putative ABC transport system substrate-binding protein